MCPIRAIPVTYRNRPIPSTYGGPGWPTWLVNDQRFTDSRQDVTHVANRSARPRGERVGRHSRAIFYRDARYLLRLDYQLIDGYPHTDAKDPPLGGYELTIAGDLLRGRFREGYEHPKQCKRTRLPDTGSICSRIITRF